MNAPARRDSPFVERVARCGMPRPAARRLERQLDQVDAGPLTPDQRVRLMWRLTRSAVKAMRAVRA